MIATPAWPPRSLQRLFVANPLAVKATVALLIGNSELAAGYLRRQRDAHLARMREYTRLKTAPSTSIPGSA